jgi:hypothetical protein
MSFDSETNTHISDGYNYCYGCGSQEEIETLRQLDGFCSSECERENGHRFNFRTGLPLKKEE